MCNSYSGLREFLKHGIHLLLNLRGVFIPFSQIAGGISSASHDHRKKTEMLGKILLPNKKGEPRLLHVKEFCRF